MSIKVWGTVPQPGTFDMVTKAHTSSVDPMPDNDAATIELVVTP